MTEPAVLFVKPGAVKPSDKTALRKAGIVVVEVEDPNAVKFIVPQRLPSELTPTDLLMAAISAVVGGGETQRFGAAVANLIKAAHDRTNPPGHQP